jgi:hypothetical protein
MEREVYQSLYRVVYDLARVRRTKYVVFPDRVIVLTYFWAVLHDRPVAWACQKLIGRHTGTAFYPALQR